jgi:hypothetical protein
LAAIKIRDTVFEREEPTAAEMTASLKAADWLEYSGQKNGGSISVGDINISPGYVIILNAGEKHSSVLTKHQPEQDKLLNYNDVVTIDPE